MRVSSHDTREARRRVTFLREQAAFLELKDPWASVVLAEDAEILDALLAELDTLRADKEFLTGSVNHWSEIAHRQEAELVSLRKALLALKRNPGALWAERREIIDAALAAGSRVEDGQ